MKVLQEKKLTISLDNGEVNKMIVSIPMTGGSDDEFTPDDNQVPATGAEYAIKSIEKRFFNVLKDSTLSYDILSEIEGAVADVTGIQIYGYYPDVENKNAQVPVRFKLEIKAGAMPSLINLGSVSEFSLNNILDNQITQLKISEVVVPVDVEANILILIFSKNQNS